MYHLSKIHRIVPLLIVFFAVLLLPGCGKNPASQALTPKTLTYWGVWDEPAAVAELANAYHAVYPHISINYRKFRYEEYEKALFDAWVRGTGPDIFSISNTWVGKYMEFMTPLPAVTTMGVKKVTKKLGIKEEIEISLQKNVSPVPQQVANDYVDVVSRDVIRNGQVYGLPYSVDTLVLFYNKDLLAKAGIALPPETWQEFVEDIPKLTIQDKEGKVVQAGAALGTAKNVSRSADILSLLLMQNGTTMIDPNSGRTGFHLPVQGGTYLPGVKALEFYTDFASPTKEVYTWNEDLPNSLDAFIAGQTAFFFGYSYHIPSLESQKSVNYGISKIPQVSPSSAKSFTNYWLASVSNKSPFANEAWDFIKFATKPEIVDRYLTVSKKPTALKSLINKQLQDFDLYIFAEQALIADSWYHGRDPLLAEQAMQEMIQSVNEGTLETYKSIENAQRKIDSTL